MVWFKPSFRFVTPVHERKRDSNGEEKTADHDQYLLHLIPVVLIDFLALDVSVPIHTIKHLLSAIYTCSPSPIGVNISHEVSPVKRIILISDDVK